MWERGGAARFEILRPAAPPQAAQVELAAAPGPPAPAAPPASSSSAGQLSRGGSANTCTTPAASAPAPSPYEQLQGCLRRAPPKNPKSILANELVSSPHDGLVQHHTRRDCTCNH